VGGESPAAAGICQAWLQIVAGARNKPGEMIQARIAALTGEDQAAA
jgi:hypothetical protein